jgi:hypothetical protein
MEWLFLRYFVWLIKLMHLSLILVLFRNKSESVMEVFAIANFYFHWLHYYWLQFYLLTLSCIHCNERCSTLPLLYPLFSISCWNELFLGRLIQQFIPLNTHEVILEVVRQCLELVLTMMNVRLFISLIFLSFLMIFHQDDGIMLFTTLFFILKSVICVIDIIDITKRNK